MKSIDLITRILVLVGAFNWGLVGVAKFDLVAAVLGAGSALSNVVYALVGISALVQVVRLFTTQTAIATAPAH